MKKTETDRNIVITTEEINVSRGTNEQKVINEMEVKYEEIMGKEKKKQKVSVSYTMKSYANNIKKLEGSKMITHEEAEQLKDLYKKMVNRWVSIEMTI